LSMQLIIAEKPSVARDIAQALHITSKQEGYFQGSQALVTWAFGHLLSLADPSAYHPDWAHWTWNALPMLPETFNLAPLPRSRTQLALLRRLAQKAEVDAIICATDADREGELIFRWIARYCHFAKPLKRLWLSENTPEAIRRAMAQVQADSDFDALAQAAQSRAEADWIVGLNGTRALTLRHGTRGQGPLSIGRVQTPTLALIVQRDQAIEAFRPAPYFQVQAQFRTQAGEEYLGLWQKGDQDRFETQAEALAVMQRLQGAQSGVVGQKEVKTVRIKPPLPFSLTELQKVANRRWGLTAQQTLSAAQTLYEKHVISYPRTSAQAVTADIAATFSQRLAQLAQQAVYADLIHHEVDSARASRLVHADQVAQAGHYAIIPTGQRISGGSAVEQKLYDGIVRRFLAALGKEGVDEKTRWITQVETEPFVTSGTTVLQAGWRAIEKAGEDLEKEGNGALPAVADGDRVHVQQVEILEKVTKAPAFLNDASLLKAMEAHGLGTPATRAGIVETLIERQYILREKKSLKSTEKGRMVWSLAPDSLKSPQLTGEWEEQLEQMAQGNGDPAVFRQSIQTYIHAVVEAIHAQETVRTILAEDWGPCPICQEGRVIAGKKGWGCSRWKEGCPLTIWKKIAHKALTNAQVKTLLA
ncbi:MAG: DNA topoisomerase 3, partial [Firmicutes bacterium]|nr:DNA topoisomerase 3 [Bacillota bacterium]